MRSLGSKIAGTIGVGIGWVVFILLFLAFYAGNFTFWQNLAIFIASAVVATGLIVVMWIRWALG